MIFGKHINRYYLRYLGWLILGLLALVMVDYLQLEIPELYGMVVNGMNNGFVMVDGVQVPFDMDFVLDTICMPMVMIILAMVFGRFLWRICFFGSAVKLEEDLPIIDGAGVPAGLHGGGAVDSGKAAGWLPDSGKSRWRSGNHGNRGERAGGDPSAGRSY